MVHVLQNPVDTCSYLPTPNGAHYDLLQSFHVEYLSSFSNNQADEFFVNLVLTPERIAIEMDDAYYTCILSKGWRDLCSHKFLDDEFRSQ